MDQTLKAGLGVQARKENISNDAHITALFREVFPEKGRQYAIEYLLQQLRFSKEEEDRQRYIALALELDDNYPIENPQLLQNLAWTFMIFNQEGSHLLRVHKWAEKALEAKDKCETNTLMAAVCLRMKNKTAGVGHAQRAIEQGKAEGVDIRMPESLLNSLYEME